MLVMLQLMQEANDDPKKWDSLVPEEEADQAQTGGKAAATASGAVSAPAVEASGAQGGAPSGGGESGASA